MRPAASRPAWVEVDLGAIAANTSTLAELVAPAELCAIVKADGYGHGAVEVARAAMEAGATRLGVAVVDEAIDLREAGIDAPVLVLADVAPGALPEAAERMIELTVSSKDSLEAVAAASPGCRVHLKIDTGMHRIGCGAGEAASLAASAIASGLVLEGVWTHLAVADDAAQDDVTAAQLECFSDVIAALSAEGVRPSLLHAANSGGAIHHPQSRHDMVRCGIALYGYPPSPGRPLPNGLSLRPALRLAAEVTAVRRVPAGDGVSYGWVRRLEADADVATIPVGYADGIPRSLGESGGEVLIGGRRCPLAGRVTMDQTMVVCPEGTSPGDEVVLIGEQGGERITADDWARLTGTISYEIVTRLGPRLPRQYV